MATQKLSYCDVGKIGQIGDEHDANYVTIDKPHICEKIIMIITYPIVFCHMLFLLFTHRLG